MESVVQQPAAAVAAAFSFDFPSRMFDCQAPLARHPNIFLPRGFVVKTCVSVNFSVSESLSAKERRKQRNERREELKGEQKSSRDIYDEKVSMKRSKKAAIKDPLDMDRLEERGTQWWIVRVPKNGEVNSAENLRKALSKTFPELEFEVWAAPIPSKRVLSNGSYSEKRRGLHPGCIFLHCVLNMELYTFIRGVERISGFMGSKLTFRKRWAILPTTVGKLELEAMHAKVKEEEQEFARLKEEANREKEKVKLAKKKNVKSSEKEEVDDLTCGDCELVLPSS